MTIIRRLISRFMLSLSTDPRNTAWKNLKIDK